VALRLLAISRAIASILAHAIIEHDLGAERDGALAQARGASDGITISAGMPSKAAAAATPCA
jgi:hypothetical protein